MLSDFGRIFAIQNSFQEVVQVLTRKVETGSVVEFEHNGFTDGTWHTQNILIGVRWEMIQNTICKFELWVWLPRCLNGSYF